MFNNLTLKKKFFLLSGTTGVIFLVMYFTLHVFISPIEKNWITFKNEVAARENDQTPMFSPTLEFSFCKS